jgi:hypothetical protein
LGNQSSLDITASLTGARFCQYQRQFSKSISFLTRQKLASHLSHLSHNIPFVGILFIYCYAHMKYSTVSFLSIIAAVTAAEDEVIDSVLTEEVMQISYQAAKLSALAYEVDIAQWVDVDATTNETTVYSHPDYDEIQFYNEEPDQAIVAKLDGRCYLSFRGTNVNFADWSQNINLDDVNLYKDADPTAASCEGRAGYADFLLTEPVTQGRKDLQTCYETCVDPMDCVVITGHSQGGATAAQASILLYSLNPTLVTFGQPPAVDVGCDFIPSQRFFRFVNSKLEDGEVSDCDCDSSQCSSHVLFDSLLLLLLLHSFSHLTSPHLTSPHLTSPHLTSPHLTLSYLVLSSSKEGDIGFDPVVFLPAPVSRSVHYGHFILLGEDTTAAKYLGLDQNYTFAPSFFDRQNEIAAHSIAGESYSYETRIQALLNTGLGGSNTTTNTTNFPISTDGYVNGVACDREYHELCASERCGLEYLCSSKVDELCIPETCKKDADCAGSGACIYESCAAGAVHEVELDCPCRFDSNCRSGECDQAITSFDWTCYDTGKNVSDGAVSTTSTIVNTGAAALATSTILGGLLGGLLW